VVDSLGERVYLSEQKRTEADNHRESVLSSSDRIPPVMDSAGVPSGKFSVLGIPKVLLAGAIGGGVGIALCAIVVGVAAGVVAAFETLGACLKIVLLCGYCGVLVMPFATTLIANITAGLGVTLGNSLGHNRNPKLGMTLAVITSIGVSSVSILLVQPWMISLSTDIERPELYTGIGVFMALLGLVVCVFFGSVVSDRFCESCHTDAAEVETRHYTLDRIMDSALGLLDGDRALLENLVPVHAPADDAERARIEFMKCECGETNFVRAWAHYREGDATPKALVYDGAFTPSQVVTLKEWLPLPEGDVDGNG